MRAYRDICIPFVDAVEAGLGAFWVFNNGGVLVPTPAMHSLDGFLHRDDGPAVEYDSGKRYWFWRGIAVPQQVIEAPETLSTKQILAEPNVEVRRVMMERFGFERLIRESKAKKRASDDYGVLYELDVPGDEPLVMVAVVNSTAELDGSFKDYWLRVPPTVRTPRDAVAWTFNVNDYTPAVQT